MFKRQACRGVTPVCGAGPADGHTKASQQSRRTSTSASSRSGDRFLAVGTSTLWILGPPCEPDAALHTGSQAVRTCTHRHGHTGMHTRMHTHGLTGDKTAHAHNVGHRQCMHMHTQAHVHADTRGHTGAHTSAYMGSWTRARTHTYPGSQAHTCTVTRTHKHTHVQLYGMVDSQREGVLAVWPGFKITFVIERFKSTDVLQRLDSSCGGHSVIATVTTPSCWHFCR